MSARSRVPSASRLVEQEESTLPQSAVFVVEEEGSDFLDGSGIASAGSSEAVEVPEQRPSVNTSSKTTARKRKGTRKAGPRSSTKPRDPPREASNPPAVHSETGGPPLALLALSAVGLGLGAWLLKLVWKGLKSKKPDKLLEIWNLVERVTLSRPSLPGGTSSVGLTGTSFVFSDL